MTSAERREDCYEVARKPDGAAGARRFAARVVACGHAECREAVAMAVTELAENMLKYSDGRGLFVGRICIACSGGVLRISAKNPVATSDDARSVARVVEAIDREGSAEALYRARLADLFAAPGLPRAQLGLVRIAYEGGFRLRAESTTSGVRITAERACAAR